ACSTTSCRISCMFWPAVASSSPAVASWPWNWKPKATAGWAFRTLTAEGTMTTIQTLPDTYLPPRTPHLAPALEQWCDAHRVRALQTPVPTRKTEQWKYSSRYLNLDAALAPSLPGGRKSGPALAVDGYH